MPEWRDHVRRRRPLNGVDPHRAEEIIEEIAQQLEEVYAEARRDGADDVEARARVEAEVPDWGRQAGCLPTPPFVRTRARNASRRSPREADAPPSRETAVPLA